jgi:predicted transcriptional regulator
MVEDDVLELSVRRRIYTFILNSPGLHERELSRKLAIPLSTLNYHLNYLKKRDLISSNADGLYSRYYIVGNIGFEDKQILSVLRQKIPRKIIIFLLTHREVNHRDICNHVGVAPSTASFHLKKLVTLNIIDRNQSGRETSYCIRKPQHVSDLLITYKKSFLDDAVDRFVDTWLELHPRHLKKKNSKEKS